MINEDGIIPPLRDILYKIKSTIEKLIAPFVIIFCGSHKIKNKDLTKKLCPLWNFLWSLKKVAYSLTRGSLSQSYRLLKYGYFYCLYISYYIFHLRFG